MTIEANPSSISISVVNRKRLCWGPVPAKTNLSVSL